MKHISKALIAMLICMAALIAPSAGAIGNEIVRVEGCDAADFDLMANDIGYDFTDIKKTANYVIDGGEYFIVSYGNRIAQFEVDDSGLLTLYPLMRGEGKVYYYVTKNGRNYIRYANVQINDDCDIIEEPVEILSPLPGDKPAPAYTIRITSPAVGTIYAVGQEVPIEFDTALQEGYTYQTFVNGIETDTWIPDAPGAYAVQVKAVNPSCGDCWDYDVMRNYFAA